MQYNQAGACGARFVIRRINIRSATHTGYNNIENLLILEEESVPPPIRATIPTARGPGLGLAAFGPGAACGGSLPYGRRAALSASRGRRAAKRLPAVSERF